MQMLLAVVLCAATPQPNTAKLEAEIRAKYSPRAEGIRSAVSLGLEGWELAGSTGNAVSSNRSFVASMSWVPVCQPSEPAAADMGDAHRVRIAVVMTASREAAAELLHGNMRNTILQNVGSIADLGDESRVLSGFVSPQRTLVAFRFGDAFVSVDCPTRDLAERVARLVLASLSASRPVEVE